MKLTKTLLRKLVREAIEDEMGDNPEAETISDDETENEDWDTNYSHKNEEDWKAGDMLEITRSEDGYETAVHHLTDPSKFNDKKEPGSFKFLVKIEKIAGKEDSQGSSAINLGLTHVTPKGGNKIEISHAGNMGSDIEDVKANIDGKYGDGVFDQLVKVGQAKGSPNYLYTLIVKKADFDRITSGSGSNLSEMRKIRQGFRKLLK